MSRNREASGECMSKLQDYAVYRGPRLATLGLYKRVEKALQQRQNAIQIVLCSSRKMRALARPSPTELGAESRRGTAIVGKSGVAIHCGEGRLVLGPEEDDDENRLICMDFI